MATLPRYRQDILDNPVQRAERLHLRRGSLSRFWRAIYAITIFAIIAPILWGFGIHFYRTLEASLGVLFMLNVVAIFTVEMRIMGHASDSIKREFQGKTWDLLILTGVDTWRLILGKWLGSMRGNRRDIMYLYVLRVSTFFWGMVFYLLQVDGFRRYYYHSDAPIPYIWDIRFDVQVLITGAIIMAVFLVLEMMLVASLPIALSLFRKTRKGATWIALGLRIGIPILLGLSIIWMTSVLRPILGTVKHEYTSWTYIDYSPEVNVGIGSMAAVLSDNGLGWSLLGVDALQSSREFDPSLFYLAQLIGIGLYVLWIWIMLRLAKFAAHRYNVSAPGFIPKGKPKRLIKAKPSTAVESPVLSVSKPKPRSPRETNLLGIQSPALYRCEVVRYEASQLDIAIYRMTENIPEFKLHFAGVSFFTGAMNWTNAKFEIVGDKHLQQFANTQKLDYDNLPHDSKLYVVQSQGNRVRIIATGVQI